MSRTFCRCSLVMITLMICWMRSFNKRIHGNEECKNACKGCLSSLSSSGLKVNYVKDFPQNCKELDSIISDILQNMSYQIEYKNCSECVHECRASLHGGVCSPCQLSKNCTEILLFDGGFTGQIQHAACNNSSDTTTCLDIYNKSTQSNNSICILAFDTDEETATNKIVLVSRFYSRENFSPYHERNPSDARRSADRVRREAANTARACRYSDSGVWLLNNTQNMSLQINITRDPDVRPTAPICFVEEHQHCNWSRNCSQPSGNSSWNCSNVICVDPVTICDGAVYDPNCSKNSSNDDIITLNRSSSPLCHKCGNAFKPTGGEVKVNITFPDPHSNTKDSYHDVMKNLTNMVLQAMGNKTSVSVSADNLTGIFVKKDTEQHLSPVYFMYSFQTEFNIIEDKTQLATFDKTFSVPKEAFEKASSLNASTLFASLFRFPSFPEDNKNSTLLNNEVYSIDMGEVIANLTNTFNLTFRNINPNAGVPSCSSWHGQGAAPNWTTDGCNTSYADGGVTCSCQHLTFFAVLMSIPPKDTSTSDLNNLTYITSIGCGLSLFFITIALFMHFLLRKGRASISVHILINLFLALFLLNLSFLSNESVANSGNVVGCKLMAGVMHYSMLSSFTWFGLQALHLCLQLTKNMATIQHYVTKLSIAGWAPPALVVTVIFIYQKYDKQDIVSNTGKNASICWINDSTVHYVVNIGYYCVIFLFTLLTFVVMLRWLWLLRRKQPTIVISGKKSRPSDALTIMGLCCILGLSWGFAFFAYGPLQIPALYIFTILNSFQGFFLFIYYYNSSKLVGEAESPPETSSLASSATVVENPYAKPKQF